MVNVPGWMQEDRNIVLERAGVVSKILEVTSAKSSYVYVYVYV